MKKIIYAIVMMIAFTLNVNAQSFNINGNNYTNVTKGRQSSQGTETKYTWSDRSGTSYNIFICTNGRCYVNKTSGKTGKIYKYYLNEDISKDVAKKVGIEYTYVKKSKKIAEAIKNNVKSSIGITTSGITPKVKIG